MLDQIRSNSQSFGVKLAFGIIILVFVFWGIGSLTDTGSINVVAMVNNQPITFQQFEMAYRQAEEQENSQNPGRRWSAEEKRDLGRSVFSSLLYKELVVQEAQKNNFSVSPLELRDYVETMPAFRNEAGKFDPQLYKDVLARQRMTPAQFEDSLRRDLLGQKMMAFAMGGVWADPMEARNRFNFLYQNRTVEYVFLSAEESAASYKPEPADLQKFYDAHKADYAIPQKASVQYIAVNPLKLVKPESLPEAELRQDYEAHRARFEEPRKVLASHILVQVAQDASPEEVKQAEAKIAQIRAELDAGKPFAQVADAYNGPQAAGKGGSLGWIEPGMTVPAFEKAAFAAEKGKVAGPVRTQFGLHLILVEDVKEARVKPFEEVKGEIASQLATAAGKAKVSDVLDSLLEENILGKDLAEAAKKFGLEAETSGLLSRDEMAEKLGLKADGVESVFKTAKGSSIDIPLEAGDAYLVLRVDDASPASFKPFEEVKDDVARRLREEQGAAAAGKVLMQALKDAKDGALPAEFKAKVKTSSPMERSGALDGFEPDKELSKAVFAAEKGVWIPQIFSVAGKAGTGVVACRVVKVADPEDERWQGLDRIMNNMLMRERSDGFYGLFIQELLQRGKVKILNQNTIDRVNM